MTLPIKKVYIDSRFKTADSLSNSDFRYELKESIQLPVNCTCMIDDILIPHAWYSIEENMNDRLYVRQNLGGAVTDVIITITPGNYSGASLVTQLQSKFDAAFSSGAYPVSYSTTKGTLSITVNGAMTFQILTDKDLLTKLNNTWVGTSFDSLNPMSMNEVIKNTEGNSPSYSNASPYTSGFLDLMNIHNVYIHSANLGSFTTLGCRGENTIIKKVPVTSSFGYLIADSVLSAHDYIDCGKLQLRTLSFKLTDVRGNTVPLHGAHCSFSIVFSTIKEDI